MIQGSKEVFCPFLINQLIPTCKEKQCVLWDKLEVSCSILSINEYIKMVNDKLNIIKNNTR